MRPRHLLLVLGLAALVSAASRADEPAGPPVPTSSVEAPAPRPLTPFQQELADAFATEQAELERLYEAVNQASDARAAMGIQKQIDTLKNGTELRVLGIQAKFARLAGDESRAQEIEQAMEALQAPRTRRAPIDRPAPDSK